MIKTTYVRDKERASCVDKYISLAKRDEVPTLSTKRKMFAFLGEDVTYKVLKNLRDKFANRNGGFTRVIKLGPRRGDAAEMAVVELVV